MNFVYLSPHFPQNFRLFSIRLKELGVNVLGIADVPHHQLPHDLSHEGLTEYYQVGNMEHYDEILRACGYFTHKYGKLDRFESHNEHWLQTDARIRTDFNIPGLNVTELHRFKSKSKMRAVFESAGIPVAPGTRVTDEASARAFIEATGYPVIAKPDQGVGAQHIYKIEDESQLQSFFETKPEVDYLLEDFIEADILTFDGLVDQNGQVVFYTSHKYHPSPLETVNTDANHYYYSLRHIPENVVEFGMKCVQAFQLRESFFHLEFFYFGADQPPVAMEINRRPPGGLTTDMFNFACDIDIYREWAHIVVHNTFLTPHYERKYYTCYAGRKANKPYRHTHDEIMATYSTMIMHHQPINPLFQRGMGLYGYLIRSEELAPVIEAAEFIQELSI
ncbi:MAG: ATP-grasp domain-containing protein [Gemmatimonadetes bacterium]|nr:MAG: ATP-grasp domain-containing protein [Gemmatimonadota bacterium]